MLTSLTCNGHKIMRTTMTKNNTSKDLRQHRKFVGNIPKQPSSKAQTALLQRHHVPTPNRTPRSNSGKLKQHRHPAKRTDRSNSRRSTPPSGSNMPAPKRTDHSNKGPQAAPCSGTLQQYQHARSKARRPLQEQHPQAAPSSSTLQRHQQSAQTTLTAAPSISLLQRHPAAAPTCPLQSAQATQQPKCPLQSAPMRRIIYLK